MDIVEGLVDRDQANTGWWRDLAGVHQSMAEVAKARHDWPAAARWHAAAADSLQRIAIDRGDNFRARFELARELVQLGESQLQSGDFRMVAQTLRRALDVTALEPPPQMREAYAELITNAYMFLGIALNESEPAEAVAPLREAMTFIGRWVEREPDRPDWRRALASVGEDLAQALSATEDWDDARPVYETAVEAWTYLTRVRDDAAFRRGLARTQLALARCLISGGDIRGAIRAAAPARATLAQREREDTANPTASLAYFEFVHALGEVYLRNSQWDEVDALFSEAMPVVERFIARRPDSDALRMQLVQMAWTRAQVMHKKGRHDAAVGFRRRTRDELRALASRGVPLGEQMAALLRKLEERG
jgi:tetratricopeptide (TPR) repeat protein